MLAFKLSLVPLLIASVSLIGQRFGPSITGFLAGFPIVAGPIFVMLTMEHGADFGAGVVTATLAGLVSFGAFALGYCWLSRRSHWSLSLLGGWLAYLAVALLLNRVPLTFEIAAVLAVATLLIAPRLLPRAEAVPATGSMPRSELLMRMLAGAGLVLAVTQGAAAAGPKLAGLFTPFPVASSVLAAFSHRLSGSATAIRVLRGMLAGLFGLVAFFVVEGWALPTRGLLTATTAALAVALVLQGLIFQLSLRR
jgi:hypothetical protein